MYEYIDNGSLEQWLHGEMGRNNPLTWDLRMKIAIGTAKGLVCIITQVKTLLACFNKLP